MLTPGSRIGAYEVVSLLGAGGMGEVYRARDTTLRREVALKTLPQLFAGQPDRLVRLRREAQILASLNHAGIATLYGLEELDGVPVLVMELVEGEALSNRLRRGALPLKDVLRIGREIAVALALAHEKGVLHRDLKPSNIRLTTDGHVKLLDFGLACVLAEAGAGMDSHVSTATTTPSSAGAVVGTAPYMSPEQARGQELDERSDVWACGCVLYEMLTGKRAFPGATFAEVSAAILEREPDWQALPDDTPPLLVRLLQRCLRKEKGDRLHDVADAGLELKELTEVSSSVSQPGATATRRTPAVTHRRSRARAIATIVTPVVAFAALGALALRMRERSGPPLDSRQPRFQLTLPRGVVLPGLGVGTSGLALSPDGERVAFVGCEPDQGCRLYVRHQRELDARPLAGTEGGLSPFFSPDGRWIGFAADGQLKKVARDGGAVMAMADAPRMRGATWGEDGTILFAKEGSGLFRVSADGGEAAAVTKPDPARRERHHLWPQFLPGGGAALFVAMDVDYSHDVAVVDLRTRRTKVLIAKAGGARYSPTGHLIFGQYGVVYAAPFDLGKLETTAPPVPVLEGVAMWNSPPGLSANGQARLDVARDGTLLFSPREARLPKRTLVWIDRQGGMEPLSSVQGTYVGPAVSPDGRHLAVSRIETMEASAVFVVDLERDAWTRLSFDRLTTTASWMPDGERLVAESWVEHEGARLVLLSASGARAPDTVYVSGDPPRPDDPQLPVATPDGSAVLFATQPAPSQWDIWRLGLTGKRTAEPWLATPQSEFRPSFSPDGRWVVYASGESGTGEVYVRPYLGPGARYLVSTKGGTSPRWSRDGREIFFFSRGSLWTAAVRTSPAFASDPPRELFAVPEDVDATYLFYDVTPDGKRFVMVRKDPFEMRPPELILVPKWTEELKARLAAAQPGGPR